MFFIIQCFQFPSPPPKHLQIFKFSIFLYSPASLPFHYPPFLQFYQRMKIEEITEQFLWEDRLAPLLTYLPPDQINRVREALSLAYDAHSTQRRKSGEPFITHPVEVTRILAELKMDYESLAAGLLHDTVEDCETVGLEEIGFHFGPAVQRIVEGETKFSKLPTHHPEREAAAAANDNGGARAVGAETAAVDVCATSSNTTSTTEEASAASQSQSDAKAQDLQFLFLAMTEEVRIIVVKLADRLHNMRTMASMPPGKQRRIAQETLSVFAPLARLLGLYTIKEELEELSFMYAMPQQYAVMRKSVDRLWEQQSPAVEAAAVELRRFLAEDAFLNAKLRGLRVEVTKKAMYSSWRKLQANAKSVRDVSEIAQLRVLVDTAPADAGAFDRQLCYHVMGLVHAHWAPVPGSMKDYIATPKPNNYQSLHTTVLPTGLRAAAAAAAKNGNGSNSGKVTSTLFPIEVQIRTQQMERLAQYGIAVESWSCADYARAVGADRQQLPTQYPPGSLNTSSSSSNNGASSSNGNNGASSNKSGSNGGGKLKGLSWLNLGALLTGNGAIGSTASAGSISSESDTEENNSSNGNGNGNGAAARSNGANSSNGASYYNSNGTSNGASSNGSSNNGSNALVYPNGTTTAPTATSSTTITAPGSRLDSQTMSRRINWLNSIRQWQEEFVGTLTAQEFVACVTDDLLGQGVFVFTPSGQVMRLPKGATVVDFAYHIHTDVGNTMVAAKVNGTIVGADHELANAEVVEVITYKGPPNATVIKRHQKWLANAKTKTARYKLAKFLREHAALAASVGLLAPGDSAMGEAQRGGGPGSAAGAGEGTNQAVWLLARCDDRQGLLADIANVITRHGHNIRSYSGSTDRDAALFVMEYELEGPSDALGMLCEDLSTVESVRGWECGCALPSAPRRSSNRI
jgi:(p)ppGpp synthase/HD superfamily hydrolase